jgi:glycerol-3-phosphate dehydrogenase
MIGGKWTTFRSFGELAADMALERLGQQRRVATTDRPIGGGRAFPADPGRSGLRASPQPRAFRWHAWTELFGRYGTDAEAIAVHRGRPRRAAAASGYSQA